MPGEDSTSSILLDLFGTGRVITISGNITGTKAEQRRFITAIESIVNGKQVFSDFKSSLVTTPEIYNVFIQTFNWTAEAGSESKISYNLTMLEGSGVEIDES